jgi:predicted dehydrogenase
MRRKIAIAGLGAAARHIHLPAYAGIADLNVVGGCDPVSPDGHFGFPVFSSAEQLLTTTRPDILTVATPPDSHYELVRMGLAHGCHVFCEKPFTTSLEEAMDLVERSRQSARWVVVNNQFRFMNIHREAKKQIGSPEFGDLVFLDAQQTFVTTEETESGWRGQDQQRTCKEFGTHVFDLCRFFFDEDPVAITARMPRGKTPDGPDLLNLIDLEFSDNRLAHITLDRWCAGPNRYLDLRLDGTAGSLQTHLGGGIVFSVGIQGGRRRPFLHLDVAMGGAARLYHGERFKTIATDPLAVFSHATRRLLRAFLDALAQGSVPPCHADDNRKTLVLMLAAYESAEKKRTIAMTY